MHKKVTQRVGWVENPNKPAGRLKPWFDNPSYSVIARGFVSLFLAFHYRIMRVPLGYDIAANCRIALSDGQLVGQLLRLGKIDAALVNGAAGNRAGNTLQL